MILFLIIALITTGACAQDAENSVEDPALNMLAPWDPKSEPTRAQTRSSLLNNVSEAWKLPSCKEEELIEPATPISTSAQRAHLESILIPEISFSQLPLSRALEQVGRLSVLYDKSERGVNLVLSAGPENDPKVTLTLRGLSLMRVLELTAQSVHFECDVESDAVIVCPAEGLAGVRLQTGFFPVSRAAIIRMTGGPQRSGQTPATLAEEEQALKFFFEKAGVDFKGPGRTLAFDGSELIAVQTARNLSRMQTILARYSRAEQVQIEAKFMEVQDGALEELGAQWNLSKKNHGTFQTQGAIAGSALLGGTSTLPSLASTFSQINSTSGPGNIVIPSATPGASPTNLLIPNKAPTIPNDINLGLGALPVANILGVMDGWNLQVMINALEQQNGTDLMSAPKLTVLSGKTAQIVVAQEMRYPQSYGKIDSSVGITSSVVSGGSAGVTITAGTPKDFTTRRVGVEMEVTPTVESDGHISLRLEPKVTEFEGFVEYGGSSVAISGSTTVNVPSGFFQPIFSVREIRTEVTIFDGATVVMGGLTREEVVSTHSKVPILGDIPLIGRLFQNKGESNQKRNLLIFVTAKRISAAG